MNYWLYGTESQVVAASPSRPKAEPRSSSTGALAMREDHPGPADRIGRGLGIFRFGESPVLRVLADRQRLPARFVVRGKLYGVECKRVDAPKLTPSMRIALQDLSLERIAVVYPGPRRYAIAERVEAVPLAEVTKGMAGLFPEAD